ncbi:hypothetical protein CSUI_005498 [Cystoisospora suis]|uniref:Uncharacterized protein n=1 Tax=Cystoisospora suis TaxID=483139 RepID=A0A2C6KXA3_9APIC|nr:hypothetical protein CSUI_005498 [Cystoisospora suis]
MHIEMSSLRSLFVGISMVRWRRRAVSRELRWRDSMERPESIDKISPTIEIFL